MDMAISVPITKLLKGEEMRFLQMKTMLTLQKTNTLLKKLRSILLLKAEVWIHWT